MAFAKILAPIRSKQDTGPNALRVHLQDNPSCWNAHHEPFDNQAGKATFRCPGYGWPCAEIKSVFQTRELFNHHIEKCPFYRLAKKAADAAAAQRQEQSSAAVTSKQMPPPLFRPPQRSQTWPKVRSNTASQPRRNDPPQVQQRRHPAMRPSPLGSDRHGPALVAPSAGFTHRPSRPLSNTERAARVNAANELWSERSSAFTPQQPARRRTDPPSTPGRQTRTASPSAVSVPVSALPGTPASGAVTCRLRSARSAGSAAPSLPTRGKPTK